jgi:hypothetical protein
VCCVLCAAASIQYARPSFGQGGGEEEEFELDSSSDESESESGGGGGGGEGEGEGGGEDLSDYGNVADWLAARMRIMVRDLTQPVDQSVRELGPKRVLAGEIALLFRGFQVLDRPSADGLLSPADLAAFCARHRVPLSRKELKFLVWLMDDIRRGSVSFEDVKTCYIDNRKRKKYFSCKTVEKDMASRRPEGERKSDYKMFSPRKSSVRTTDSRPSPSPGGKLGAGGAGAGACAGVEAAGAGAGVYVCEAALASDPVVLFRLLLFAAMQDASGNADLMSVYQVAGLHICYIYAT